MMKKTNLVNKFSCFLVICVFLLTTPITLATTTSINTNPDNNEIVTCDDNTYAGSMSVHPGYPNPFDWYSPELKININKDFGGVDKTIHIPRGGSLTFTADCKVKEDSGMFNEGWDFEFSILSMTDKKIGFAKWNQGDDYGPDDSGSKILEIVWYPEAKEDWISSGEGKISAKLHIHYRRTFIPDIFEHWRKTHETDKVTIILDNDPPKKPSKPTGPGSLKPGEEATFGTSTVDPNDDDLEYGWDWDGDKIVDEWMESVESGKFVSKSHVWDAQGTYNIRVKARDTYLPKAKAESGWSEPLEITVTKARSKDKTFTNPYLNAILEKLNLPLLKNILSLD